MAGEKYVRALAEAAEVTPVLLPSVQPPLPAGDWLQGLDGLLLTGAVSNIEPQHYDGGRSWPGNPHDPARDANAFALLHEALALDLPVLAICRGLQELNVALGGTLHPQVHAAPGLRIIVKTRRRRLMCSTGRPMRSPWRRMAGWRSGKAVTAHRSIRFTGRASTDWHTGCRSRPGPMMDWSRQRAAHTIVSCSAYSGTRSGVSWTRRSITLFSVRSAKLAGSTNRTDWIPDEFPNAPAQDGYAPRTAGSSLLRWLKERRITEVECLVPDITGNARGKIIPADKFSHDYGTRLPEGIFATTVTGEFPDDYYELTSPSDSDMMLRPDPDTVRMVPWAADATAQVIHDCYTKNGEPHELAPRNVLRRVLAAYAELGLRPVVAPELEFFLVQKNTDPDFPLLPPAGRSGRPELRGSRTRSMRSTNSTRSST